MKSQPFKYSILWDANTKRRWFVESDSPNTIILDCQPSKLHAFLVDVENVNNSGSLDITFSNVTDIEENKKITKKFHLYQNYPNPFNPFTKISYILPKVSKVKLEILDILGKLIRMLVNEKEEAGMYSVTWDAKDSNEHDMPSGVYIYRLQAGDFVHSRKMILLR